MVTLYLDGLRNMEDASYTLKVMFSILTLNMKKILAITWFKNSLAPNRIVWVGQIEKLDRT